MNVTFIINEGGILRRDNFVRSLRDMADKIESLNAPEVRFQILDKEKNIRAIDFKFSNP